MRPLGRKQKVLGFLALAALGLLLAPFVAVQIQERIFRHRAEQLLADMRALMMHKPSLAEIQAVFKRWNPPHSGCFEQDCWFQIDLSYGPFPHFLDYRGVPDIAVLWAFQPKLWLRPFRMYGGRLAHARAYARVVHGVVLGILFQVDMEISAPPDNWKTGDSHQLLILDASTDRPTTSLPPEVCPGNRFIMLVESGFDYRWVKTERCGIVPLNPANLELVRQANAGSLPPAKP